MASFVFNLLPAFVGWLSPAAASALAAFMYAMPRRALAICLRASAPASRLTAVPSLLPACKILLSLAAACSTMRLPSFIPGAAALFCPVPDTDLGMMALC